MEVDFDKAGDLFDGGRLALIRRMFSRAELSPEKRAISAIACLQAIGDSKNLVSILKLIVTGRSELRMVYEALLQGYLFCGYPRAIESFFCLGEATSSREDLDPGLFPARHFGKSDDLSERGMETHKAVHGKNSARMRNKISALCPDLAYLMITEGYGHVLSRPYLDMKTRELAIVSSISAIGSNRQLNSHIRGCRNVGCKDVEIYESIFTGLLWLPAGRVEESIGIWSDITGHTVSEAITDFIE